MENNKLIEIIKWIKGKPMFKWGLMCDEIGFDRGNFQRIMQSKTPKINSDFIPKIISVLKKYGYVVEGGGLPLPADYVEVKDVAILHTNGVVEEIVELKVGDKKAWNKALKESKTYGKKKKVNKKAKSKAKVTVTDLTKPTGKKVVSDPPPKKKYVIDTRADRLREIKNKK